MTQEPPIRVIMIALTNCVPGREAEFEEWYDGVHLRDLVAVPGVVSGQRFEVVPSEGAPPAPYQYLALYEIEGPVETVWTNLAASRADRVVSDALAPGATMWSFRAIGPRATG